MPIRVKFYQRNEHILYEDDANTFLDEEGHRSVIRPQITEIPRDEDPRHHDAMRTKRIVSFEPNCVLRFEDGDTSRVPWFLWPLRCGPTVSIPPDGPIGAIAILLDQDVLSIELWTEAEEWPDVRVRHMLSLAETNGSATLRPRRTLPRRGLDHSFSSALELLTLPPSESERMVIAPSISIFLSGLKRVASGHTLVVFAGQLPRSIWRIRDGEDGPTYVGVNALLASTYLRSLCAACGILDHPSKPVDLPWVTETKWHPTLLRTIGGVLRTTDTFPTDPKLVAHARVWDDAFFVGFSQRDQDMLEGLLQSIRARRTFVVRNGLHLGPSDPAAWFHTSRDQTRVQFDVHVARRSDLFELVRSLPSTTIVLPMECRKGTSLRRFSRDLQHHTQKIVACGARHRADVICVPREFHGFDVAPEMLYASGVVVVSENEDPFLAREALLKLAHVCRKDSPLHVVRIRSFSNVDETVVA